MRRSFNYVLLLSGLLLSFSFAAQATHIRAGEILAELVSCQSFKYRFRVIGYEDTEGNVEFGSGEINFGDGEVSTVDTRTGFINRVFIDPQNKIRRSEFIVEHTFPGPGVYTISFREENRNEGIANMSESVHTAFHIETRIVIDPFVGCNNSPVLTNPPVDGAVIGQTFLHNPGAFDPDGDSLAYKFVIPKQDRDQNVDNYNYPDTFDIRFGENPSPSNQQGNAPPSISLDPLTGELVWDAPNNPGEFNVAFIVEEWRLVEGEWVQLGYVTRDMQILVDDSDNEPPVLTIPADTCVEAGTLLAARVSALDPDNNTIQMNAFGEVFQQAPNPATFSPTSVQPSPATGNFQWQTACSDVRLAPYQINFKAADVDVATGPSLADYQTWNVTVVGPAPQNLQAEAAAARSVNLTWDAYSCGNQSGIQLQLWRKTDPGNFTPDNCQTGIPEGLGYEQVATLDQSVVSYRDQSLSPGVNYCYRLVAVFPDGAESYASQEVCAEMLIDAPLITEVSVLQTDAAAGTVRISWIPPIEIDTLSFPPPYSYEVVRLSGSGATATGTVVSDRLSETSFTDTGLNTLNEAYRYKVYLYDASNTLTDSSATASTVRLEPAAQVGSIQLQWQASVPWTNNTPAYPYHYIYRNQVSAENPEALLLIDSVNVTAAEGYTYLDDGRFNGQSLSDALSYCYFVTTQGSYSNPQVPAPLLNNSQQACAQPNDTIPPCTPVALSIPNAGGGQDCEAQLAGLSCEQNSFENTLNWQRDAQAGCDDDIRAFNIYFSATGAEDSYSLLATTTDTFFVHAQLPSFAGCYRLSSVDRSGNESALSEPVCNDNCPVYELPNVFTPDGNDKNATFRPFDGRTGPCPRFVESVRFRVYNRWGKQIYTYESGNERSILIHWDGRLESGQLVPAGVYYYVAEVTFLTLSPANRQQTIKGWVSVLYSDPLLE